MSSLTQTLPPPQPQPSATSSSRLLTPTTLPIPLLSSQLAKRYSYAHTVLVPAYYFLRSSALVADPFPTMLTDLLVVGFLQAAFCAVCLPSAGYWVSGTAAGKIIEGTASKSSKSGNRSVSGAVGAGGGLRKKGGSAAYGNFNSRVMVSPRHPRLILEGRTS